MKSTPKHLIYSALTIVWLLCAAPFGIAQQYTASELELHTGWRLEFKGGSTLSFDTTSGALELRWEGKVARHPWLGQSQRVAFQTLEEQDPAEFDRFSQKQLKSAKSLWLEAKQRHKQKEENRLLKEKRVYEDKIKKQRQKHEDKLAEWKQQKAEFDKEAEAEYQEAFQEWREVNQEYQQEHKEYLAEKKEYEDKGASIFSPSSWFGAPDPPEDERPPQPTRQQFPTPKPSEPGIVEYVPSPDRPFTELEPQLNASPAYQAGPLALHLAFQGCPTEEFRLKLGTQIHFVKSRSQAVQGSSPWGKDTKLLQCEVVPLNSGEPLLKVQSDENRLVLIELGRPKTRLELLRIVSPKLKDFEQGLAQREMYLKTLFRWQQEPVQARYREMQERTQLDLSYTATDQAMQLRATLPVQFYNPTEKNKRNMAVRVDEFQEREYGGLARLLLRQLTTHPPGTPGQWRLKAAVHYAFVDGDLANLIKVQNRSGGALKKLQIGSDGQVFDFSGLWYLVSWANRAGASEFPLVYFNDTRVLIMRLVRSVEDAVVRFEGRDVSVTIWTLFNVEGVETYRFQVGAEGHIVYEFQDLAVKRTLQLQEIGTKTTRKNQKWAKKYQQQHRLVALVR